MLALLIVMIAGGIPLFRFVQRNTDFGIFILGGGDYWVLEACECSADDEASRILQKVVDATQYGVDTAQNGVNELDDPRDRLRLFRLLIDVAPNDHWKRLYGLDVERQLKILSVVEIEPQ